MNNLVMLGTLCLALLFSVERDYTVSLPEISNLEQQSSELRGGEPDPPIALCKDVTVQLDPLGLASVTALPVELANSANDFSGVQGQSGWQYGSNAAFDAQGFQPLPNFTGFVWNNPGTILDFPQLDGLGGHPQIENLFWAVRRWSSSYTGDILIQGDFFDRDQNCGDGAHVRIFQNGVEVFQFLNIPGSLTPYSLPLQVNLNDTIDFVIDPIFDPGCDDTHFTAVISTVNGVDNGSNDPSGIASLTVSPNSFTCAELGANTVTLTVTSNNSLTSTCTATVAVEDNIDPVAVCQDITVNLTGASTTIIPGDVDDGSSDNCSVSLSLDNDTFDCSDAQTGSDVVTLTATDPAGNTATCTATVTVQDNIDPVAVCQDVTVTLSGTSAPLTTGQLDNGSADNCPIVLTLSQNSVTCADAGIIGVDLIATDESGNVGSCTASITVFDLDPPTALCQDITVQLDASGIASILPSDIDAGSSDECGVALSVAPAIFDCDDVGPNTVTLGATDAFTLTSCTATVTVEDNIAPVLACAPNVTVNTDAGQCNAVVTVTPPSVADNCTISNGNTTIVGLSTAGDFITDENPLGAFDQISIDLPDGSTVVDINVDVDISHTWVSDIDVGILSPSFTTVLLLSRPVNCSDDNMLITFDDEAALTASALDNLCNGDDPWYTGSAQPLNPLSGFDGEIASGLWTFYVQDFASFDNGTINSWSITIEFNDPNGRTLAQTFTRDLRAERRTEIDLTRFAASSSDQKATITQPTFQRAAGDTLYTIINDFNNTANASGTYPVGTTPVLWTVTDAGGNTDTCTQFITVVDAEGPNAICQDLTVQLDAGGSASITTSDVNNGSNDACGIAGLSIDENSFDCSDIGATPTPEIWINEFHYDNVSGDVGEFVEIAGTAGYDLTGVTIVLYNGSGGTVYNTIAASGTIDDEGNGFGAISFPISGIQNGSPDGIALVDNGGGLIEFLSYEGSFTGSGGAADGVTSTDVVVEETSTTPVGESLQRTGTGNSAADFTFTGPVAESPGDLNSGQSITTVASGVIVTLTVTDVNSNSSTCTANVTVEDNVAPVAVCQDITVQLDGSGNAGIVAADADGGSTDACGIASLSVDNNSFDCNDASSTPLPQIWINEFHYDNDGGDVGEFVEIAGTAGYDLTGASIVLYNGSNGAGYATFPLTGSIDDEGDGFGAVSIATAGMQNGGPDGIALVANGGALIEFLSYEGSFTGVGGAADGVTSTDVVVVETSTTPIGESIQRSGNGNTAGDFTFSGPSAESPGSLNAGQTITAPTAGSVVTLTVTDVNGNSSTCTASVAVEDNMAPTALCQDITVQLDASGNLSLNAADVDGGSSDNCAIDGLSASPTAFTCAEVGANTVTLTVTDVSGNSSTCTSTVTVEDSAPIVVCQDITIQLDAGGNASIVAANVDGGSSDACGIASSSIDISAFDCSNVGDGPEPRIWINEIHYDNSGTDVGEFVEIAGDAGYDLSLASIVFYNGSNGEVYMTELLSGSIDDEGSGYGALSFAIPGIQNGAPDGLALVDNGIVIEYLSYEGVRIASDGPAVGLLSIDIGVIEPATSAIGESLQRTGSGSSGSDFSWVGPVAESPGTLNSGQTGVAPSAGSPVVLTITNVNGNTNSCTAYVEVQDNIAPTAICQDVTVQFDISGTATVLAGDVDGGSTDVCGIGSVALDITTFGCGDAGPNSVTLTVTDANGNSSTCTAIVTVEGEVDDIEATIVPEFIDKLCQGESVLLTVSTTSIIEDYLWSTGETTPTIVVADTGVYSVTLNATTNCSATVSYDLTIGAEEIASTYTIIAERNVLLRNRNVVNSGGVGVTSATGLARIRNQSTVSTFVKGATIDISANSTVAEVIPEQAIIQLPGFQNNTTSGHPIVLVAPNTNVVLSGCAYDEVQIKTGAIVTFTCDNVFIGKLVFGPDVTIQFAGPSNLYVREKVVFASGMDFNPTAEFVYCYMMDNVLVNPGSSIVAHMFIKKNLNVQGSNTDPVSMVGQFIGRRVRGSDFVTWGWDVKCDPVPVVLPPPSVVRQLVEEVEPSNEVKVELGDMALSVFPNPFMQTARVNFRLPESARTSIEIADINGSVLEAADLGVLDAGVMHEFEYQPGKSLSAGTYIVRVISGSHISTTKLVYIR